MEKLGTREASGVLRVGVDTTQSAKDKAVPMASGASDKLVVALKPGNAGGAKGLTRMRWDARERTPGRIRDSRLLRSDDKARHSGISDSRLQKSGSQASRPSAYLPTLTTESVNHKLSTMALSQKARRTTAHQRSSALATINVLP